MAELKGWVPGHAGVQMMLAQALDARHESSGFDSSSRISYCFDISCCFLFLAFGMGMFTVSLYFGSMPLFISFVYRDSPAYKSQVSEETLDFEL